MIYQEITHPELNGCDYAKLSLLVYGRIISWSRCIGTLYIRIFFSNKERALCRSGGQKLTGTECEAANVPVNMRTGCRVGWPQQPYPTLSSRRLKTERVKNSVFTDWLIMLHVTKQAATNETSCKGELKATLDRLRFPNAYCFENK